MFTFLKRTTILTVILVGVLLSAAKATSSEAQRFENPFQMWFYGQCMLVLGTHDNGDLLLRHTPSQCNSRTYNYNL